MRSNQEYFEYLLSCGFSESEAEERMKDREVMRKLYFKKKEPREITSSTYERAQKRLKKDVENFMRGRK